MVNLIYCSHRRYSFHQHLRFLVVGKLIHFKMVCYCALRRLSSFVVLMCILVATFFIIFSPFHGLKIPLFKSNTISGKMVQEKQLLKFGIKSDDDGNKMMALHKPFPPDLNPTPRRSKRGTPDNTFGTLYYISNSLLLSVFLIFSGMLINLLELSCSNLQSKNSSQLQNLWS